MKKRIFSLLMVLGMVLSGCSLEDPEIGDMAQDAVEQVRNDSSKFKGID